MARLKIYNDTTDTWEYVSTPNGLASASDIDAGTDTSKSLTSAAVADSFIGVKGGWIKTTNPTYSSADAPSYSVVFSSGEVPSTFTAGMRVRLTDDSTTKYFIITAVGAGGGGEVGLTLYGGTTYTLSGGTITNFCYSGQKIPYGFPARPSLWTVTTKLSASAVQTSPTQNTWYNVMTAVMPVGAWRASYSGLLAGFSTSSQTSARAKITLSTANNSESDNDNTTYIGTTGASGTLITLAPVYSESDILVYAKTNYYINMASPLTSAEVSYIQVPIVVQPFIVKFVCAYL